MEVVGQGLPVLVWSLRSQCVPTVEVLQGQELHHGEFAETPVPSNHSQCMEGYISGDEEA